MYNIPHENEGICKSLNTNTNRPVSHIRVLCLNNKTLYQFSIFIKLHQRIILWRVSNTQKRQEQTTNTNNKRTKLLHRTRVTPRNCRLQRNGNLANFFSYVCIGKKFKELFASALNGITASVI